MSREVPGRRLTIRLCRSPGFLARRSLAVARGRAGRLFRLFAALFRLRFAGGRRAFRPGRAAGLILASGVLDWFEYGRKSHIGFIEQLELTAGVGIARGSDPDGAQRRDGDRPV